MPVTLDDKPQLEFLYKALEDAQNTIRFTDTKAGVIIVASGILSTYLVTLGKAFLDHAKYPLTMYSLSTFIIGIICFGSFLLSLIITFRAINPISSPIDHIKAEGLSANMPFYLYKINPKLGIKDWLFEVNTSKLNYSSKQLFENLMADKDSKEIIKSLVLEVCQVSYIREKKIYRVNIAFVFLAIGFIALFISSLMSHSIQWL